MKSAFLTILLLSLYGCAGSPIMTTYSASRQANVRSDNRTKLSGLRIGMTKDQVLAVMGSEPSTVFLGLGATSDVIPNPFRDEVLPTADGRTVEIISYYTDLQALDGAITDDELTPIILIDGKVAGWGRTFLDQSVQKVEIRQR